MRFFFLKKKRKRIWETKTTYNELVVNTILTKTFDKYELYPLLGDLELKPETPSSSPPPPRLKTLMDPQTTIIGQADSAFLELLQNWEGSPSRQPWMMAEVLGCPMQNSAFKRFTKAQIMRLDAAR